MAGKIKDLTDDNFQAEALASDLPVLVKFWAPWCGPCRQIAPILGQLADEYDGKLVVAKVNIDEEAATAAGNHVMSVPTIHLIQGGEIIKTVVGAVSKARLVQQLDLAKYAA